MKKRKPSVSLHLPESTAPLHLAVMIRSDGTVETVEVGEEITPLEFEAQEQEG